MSESMCDCPACDSAISDLRSQVRSFEGTAQVLSTRLGALKDKIHLRFAELNERVALLRVDNNVLRNTVQQLYLRPADQVSVNNLQFDCSNSSQQEIPPHFSVEMLRETAIDCAECAKLINDASLNADLSQRVPIRPTAIQPNCEPADVHGHQVHVEHVQQPSIANSTQQLTAPSILQLSSILTPSPSPHRDASITSPTSTIDSTKADRQLTRSKQITSASKTATVTAADLLETPTSSASTDKCRNEQEYVNQAVISEFVRKRSLMKKAVGLQLQSQSLPNEKRLGTVIPTPSPAVSNERLPSCSASSSLPRSAMRPPVFTRHTSESPKFDRNRGNTPIDIRTQVAADQHNSGLAKLVDSDAEMCESCAMNVCDRLAINTTTIVFLMIDSRSLLYSTSDENHVIRNLQQLMASSCSDQYNASLKFSACTSRSPNSNPKARKFCLSDVDLPQPTDELLLHPSSQRTQQQQQHMHNVSGNLLLENSVGFGSSRSRKTVRIVDVNGNGVGKVKSRANCGYLYQLESSCPQPSHATKQKGPHWHKYWFVLRDNTLFAYNAMLDAKTNTEMTNETPSTSFVLDADSKVELLARDNLRSILHLTLENGARHVHLTDAPLANMNHCDCPHCLSLAAWQVAILRSVHSTIAYRVYSRLNRFRSDSAAKHMRPTPIRVCGATGYDSSEVLFGFLVERYLMIATQSSFSDKDMSKILVDCYDLAQLESLCSDQSSIAFWNRQSQSVIVIIFENRDARIVNDWYEYAASYSANFMQPETTWLLSHVGADQLNASAEQSCTIRETSASPQRPKANANANANANGNRHQFEKHQNESQRNAHTQQINKQTHSANWQQAYASGPSSNSNLPESAQGLSVFRTKPTLEDRFLLAVLDEPHLFDTLTINTLDYVQTVRQKQLELSNLLDLLLCTASCSPCSTIQSNPKSACSAIAVNNNNSMMMHISPSRKSVSLLKRLCTLCFEHPFLIDSVYQELVRCTATEFCSPSSPILTSTATTIRFCTDQDDASMQRRRRDLSLLKTDKPIPKATELSKQSSDKRSPKQSASASSIFAKLCNVASSNAQTERQAAVPAPSCVHSEQSDMSLLVTRSWQLLAVLTSVFTPRNRMLQRALWIHLKRNANTATESGRYAQFCLKALRRTFGQALESVYEPQTPPIYAQNNLQKPQFFRSPSVPRSNLQSIASSPRLHHASGNLRKEKRAQNKSDSCTDCRGARRDCMKTFENERSRKRDAAIHHAAQRAQVPSSVELRSLLLCNPLTYTTPLTVTVQFSTNADSLLSVAMPVAKAIGFDSFTTIDDIFNALERSMHLRNANCNGLTLCCILPSGEIHELPADYILADAVSRLEQLSESSEAGSMCTSMTQSQISFSGNSETPTPTLLCRLATFRPANWYFENQTNENERLIVVESVIDALINCPVRCWTFPVLSSLIGKYSRVVCSIAQQQSRLDIQRVYTCCKALLSRLRDSGKLHSHELSFLRKCINDVLTTVMTNRDTSARQLPSMTLDDVLATISEYPFFTANWFQISDFRLLSSAPRHVAGDESASSADREAEALTGGSASALYISLCFQSVAVWSVSSARPTDGSSPRPLLVCDMRDISAYGKCTLEQLPRPQMFFNFQRNERRSISGVANNLSISTYDNGSNYGLVQVCNATLGEHSCFPHAMLDTDANPFYAVVCMSSHHDVCRALDIVRYYAEAATSAPAPAPAAGAGAEAAATATVSNDAETL